MTTSENDIVLDYHLGSGTTAAVAHKLNRRYIGIEQLDYGDNDSVVRLQNVINGDPTGISKSVNWNGGGSFVYMELKKYNQLFIESIEKCKTLVELEDVIRKIFELGFISYSLDKIAFDNYKNEFHTLELEIQKSCAKTLLDLNLLYVPFSEINDADYKCSKEELILNQSFYNLKIK